MKKVKTLNISLPAALLAKADRLAEREYRSRSEVLRESLRRYVNEREEWEEIFRYWRKKGKEAGIKSEEQINQMVWEYRHGKSRQAQNRS